MSFLIQRKKTNLKHIYEGQGNSKRTGFFEETRMRHYYPERFENYEVHLTQLNLLGGGSPSQTNLDL